MQQLGRVWVVVKVDEPVELPVSTSGVNVVEGSSRMIHLARVAQWLDTGALQATCGCSLMHQSGRWKLHGNPTFLSRKLTILHQIQSKNPIESSCTALCAASLGVIQSPHAQLPKLSILAPCNDFTPIGTKRVTNPFVGDSLMLGQG